MHIDFVMCKKNIQTRSLDDSLTFFKLIELEIWGFTADASRVINAAPFLQAGSKAAIDRA